MSSNPILSSPRNIFGYAVVWLISTVLYIQILIIVEKLEITTAFADGFIFSTLLFGFGLSYWHSAKYISVENNSISKILISHAIGSHLSVLLWLALGYWFMNILVSSDANYHQFFMSNIGWRILVGTLLYFLITAFYYLVIYYTSFQDKILRENELKNLVTQAELKSLKFQINPHFIFNSLNSMSALTTIDPTKARNMILKLAEFLRYTLVNNERQKNKLSEEINSIKLYLDIEKIRFEDKFDFIEAVSPESKDQLVPSMILQPLFENAIKHAVYESLEKVTLRFKSKVENDFLHISLENNFDSNSSSKSGSGIGLKNISDRLKLIYSLNNLMHVKKTDGLFKVDIFIPLNTSS